MSDSGRKLWEQGMIITERNEFCKNGCDGFSSGCAEDKRNGILPRGLVFDENEISGNAPGIVFVGFNPAPCKGSIIWEEC